MLAPAMSAGAQRPGSPPWGFNPYAPPGQAGDTLASRPPVAPGELRLASPSQRLVAKLLDRVLLGILLAPGIVTQARWDTNLGVGIWVLTLLGFWLTQWTLIAATGQSFGKRWLGLRVVTDKGGRVGLLRGVLLRIWVMWMGSMPTGGFVLLLDPWFVLGKQRKALHDTLAGTIVIVANTPGDPYQR